MATPRDTVFSLVPSGRVGWKVARRTLEIPGRETEREWVLVEYEQGREGTWIRRLGGAIVVLPDAPWQPFAKVAARLLADGFEPR